jgi:hypothetical protein
VTTILNKIRRLSVLEAADLSRVRGSGDTASTSTSGTPAAGDDTVGDATLGTRGVDFFLRLPGIDGESTDP